MSNELTWMELGRLINSRNKSYEILTIIKKIKKLAKKHHSLCEMDCNGEGWIDGKFYDCRNESGYTNSNKDKTVFYSRIQETERKIINALGRELSFDLKFQTDPRGWTVRIKYKNEDISELIH